MKEFEQSLRRDIAELAMRISALHERKKFLQGMLAGGREEREAAPDVRVSDHAVLRYLERKYGMDIDALRAEILTPQRQKAFARGCRAVRAGEVLFIAKNGTVVTVLRSARRERGER